MNLNCDVDEKCSKLNDSRDQITEQNSKIEFKARKLHIFIKKIARKHQLNSYDQNILSSTLKKLPIKDQTKNLVKALALLYTNYLKKNISSHTDFITYLSSEKPPTNISIYVYARTMHHLNHLNKSEKNLISLLDILENLHKDPEIDIDMIFPSIVKFLTLGTQKSLNAIKSIQDLITQNKSSKTIFVAVIYFITSNYNTYYENILNFNQETIDSIYVVFQNYMLHKNSNKEAYVRVIELCIELNQLNIRTNLIVNLEPNEIQNTFDIINIAKKTLSTPNIELKNYKFYNLLNNQSTLNCLKNNYKYFQFFQAAMTLGPEIVQEFLKARSMATNEKENVWEHYVVRKNHWADKLYSPDQKHYGNLMHKAVTYASTKLELWNYRQLMSFLELNRHLISIDQKPILSPGVGLLRCGSPGYTYCMGNYKELGDRITQKLSDFNPNKHPNLEVITEHSTNHTITVEYINDKKLHLSKFSYLPTDVLYIEHTKWETTEIILEHVSKLYLQALENDNPETLLPQLGEIFWWICQAKPYCLGDPSIAESLIRTIRHYKTKKLLPPWKKDLIPWETTVEQFSVTIHAKDFSILFDHEF